jgi:hypothetical protein
LINDGYCTREGGYVHNYSTSDPSECVHGVEEASYSCEASTSNKKICKNNSTKQECDSQSGCKNECKRKKCLNFLTEKDCDEITHCEYEITGFNEHTGFRTGFCRYKYDLGENPCEDPDNCENINDCEFACDEGSIYNSYPDCKYGTSYHCIIDDALIPRKLCDPTDCGNAKCESSFQQYQSNPSLDYSEYTGSCARNATS